MPPGLTQPTYRALYEAELAVYSFPDGELLTPPSRVAEVVNARDDLRGFRPLGIIQHVCLSNGIRASLYDDDDVYVGLVLSNGRVRWRVTTPDSP